MLRPSALGLVCLATVTTACAELTREDMLGTYQATTFTLSNGTDEDVLAAGGSLEITLNQDGTTAGRLVVPAGVGGSPDEVDLDLDGTWMLVEDVVTFDHDADTFIRDVIWQASAGRLTASGTFSGVTIDVTLRR